MATKQDRIERALRHPVSWVIGGIVSVATVFSAIGLHPVAAGADIVAVILGNATNLFTGLSILGFTIAPNVSLFAGWVWAIQGFAIFMGVIVVGKIVMLIWDRFKSRVLEG